jgi:formate-dependent nitrite reductase cytochrome c552 subunit
MARGRPQKHREGELCESCGLQEKQFKGYSITGTRAYRRTCQSCHRTEHGQFRKDQCELCGYRPLFMRSLDVHHRDGDKKNGDESNLMTLCATCHRELEASIHDLGDWNKAESWLKKFITRAFK